MKVIKENNQLKFKYLESTYVISTNRASLQVEINTVYLYKMHATLSKGLLLNNHLSSLNFRRVRSGSHRFYSQHIENADFPIKN